MPVGVGIPPSQKGSVQGLLLTMDQWDQRAPVDGLLWQLVASGQLQERWIKVHGDHGLSCFHGRDLAGPGDECRDANPSLIVPALAGAERIIARWPFFR